MLEQIGKDMPDYLKEVNFWWLHAGRVMNCLVVIDAQQKESMFHFPTAQAGLCCINIALDP